MFKICLSSYYPFALFLSDYAADFLSLFVSLHQNFLVFFVRNDLNPEIKHNFECVFLSPGQICGIVENLAAVVNKKIVGKLFGTLQPCINVSVCLFLFHPVINIHLYQIYFYDILNPIFSIVI